jgi:hypothetical protein
MCLRLQIDSTSGTEKRLDEKVVLVFVLRGIDRYGCRLQSFSLRKG